MGELSAAAASSVIEEESKLIEKLERIITSLESRKSLGDGSRKSIEALAYRLISVTRSGEIRANEGVKPSIEHQLCLIESQILNLDFLEESTLWDSGPVEAYQFLKAVEEARKITKILETSSDGDNNALVLRADGVLQRGMATLEEEFRSLLMQNWKKPLPEMETSFRSIEEENLEDGSVISSGDDSFTDVGQIDSTVVESEDCVMELVPQDVVLFLKRIADLMFASGYGHECCNAYITLRKEALEACLAIEKVSIEDVLSMEWKPLNSEILKWMKAVRPFVQVHLLSEKALADQIFGDIEAVSFACFLDASKASTLSLLLFCEGMVAGPRQPEKLLRLLDMYEALADLMPKIAALYSFDGASCVASDFDVTLSRLKDCVKETFAEFQRATAAHASSTVPLKGGVHRLTSYVMNYLKALTDSVSTFDEVMEEGAVLVANDSSSSSIVTSPVASPRPGDDNGVAPASNLSPTERHFRSIATILESNLKEKSKVYRDEALGIIFLINNTHYMVEKVKNSELRTIFGDEWIRKRIRKFQHHAMDYQKATWNSVLAFLRREVIKNQADKSVIKERLHGFYLAFEEVYRTQTGWCIVDSRLREDVIIMVTNAVVPAYRHFVGNHQNSVREKHIKYSPEDLGDLLLDLFGGAQRSLHGGVKK